MRGVSYKELLIDTPTQLTWLERGSLGPAWAEILWLGTLYPLHPACGSGSFISGITKDQMEPPVTQHRLAITKEETCSQHDGRSATQRLSTGSLPAQFVCVCSAVRCRGKGWSSPHTLHLIHVNPHLKVTNWNHQSGKHRPHSHHVFYWHWNKLQSSLHNSTVQRFQSDTCHIHKHKACFALKHTGKVNEVEGDWRQRTDSRPRPQWGGTSTRERPFLWLGSNSKGPQRGGSEGKLFLWFQSRTNFPKLCHLLSFWFKGCHDSIKGQ